MHITYSTYNAFGSCGHKHREPFSVLECAIKRDSQLGSIKHSDSTPLSPSEERHFRRLEEQYYKG